MVKISLEEAVNVGSPITYEEVKKYGAGVELTAGYSPSREHFEAFADLTGDKNDDFHKGEQSIAPGFLQTSVAVLLIKKAMRAVDVLPLDYPFSLDHAELPGFVLPSGDYTFNVEFHLGERRTASAKLKDAEGNVVYSLERFMYEEKPADFSPNLDDVKYLCDEEFVLGDGADTPTFGRLIGSKSSESNLYAMSGTSSIVFSALDKGVLKPVSPMKAFYYSQSVVSDASKSLDLKDGIKLELYLSDWEKFGKKTFGDEVVDMKILAKDHDGRFICLSYSPLKFKKFKKERFFKLLNKATSNFVRGFSKSV